MHPLQAEKNLAPAFSKIAGAKFISESSREIYSPPTLFSITQTNERSRSPDDVEDPGSSGTYGKIP